MSASKALASLDVYADSENEEDKEMILMQESDMDISCGDEDNDAEDNNNGVEDGIIPVPSGTCPPKIAEKIKTASNIVKTGLDMNRTIQKRKEFRNPSIYEKLIDFCELDEYGTNYDANVYNPLSWGKESYYDELAKVQKAEMDRREKDRKTKIEIVSGTAKRILASTSNGINVSANEVEKKRKTKWDISN